MANKLMPSPCDTCSSNCYKNRNVEFRKCEKYKSWWDGRMAFFRRQMMRPPKLKQLGGGKFRYEHPDIVRAWLKKNPCDDCAMNTTCKKPCQMLEKWLLAHKEIADGKK